MNKHLESIHPTLTQCTTGHSPGEDPVWGEKKVATNTWPLTSSGDHSLLKASQCPAHLICLCPILQLPSGPIPRPVLITAGELHRVLQGYQESLVFPLPSSLPQLWGSQGGVTTVSCLSVCHNNALLIRVLLLWKTLNSFTIIAWLWLEYLNFGNYQSFKM